MKKDVLLEYVMPVSVMTPPPQASLDFLHKVLVVGKPNGEQPAVITECTNVSEIEALTTAKAGALLDAGLSSILVLPVNTLEEAGPVVLASDKEFFTVLIDGAIDGAELIDTTDFDGVIGWMTNDQEKAETFANKENHVCFFGKTLNDSFSMYRAFGVLLSWPTWNNQQYLEGFKEDGIKDINEAKLLFEKKVSFVLTSKEYGSRLALFASNKRAILAPYIYAELKIRLQSTALRYIYINKPAYTVVEASKLQDVLQEMISKKYIDSGIVESGTIDVEAVEGSNFVLKGYAKVAEPKAIWIIETVLQEGDV